MKIRVIQIVFGLGCTIFFLVLALFRVHLGSVGTALANADPIDPIAFVRTIALARILMPKSFVRLSAGRSRGNCRARRPDDANDKGLGIVRK